MCVVLPAGGSGLRMEIDTPKQYCKVLNRPLILYTIFSFHRISWIKQIILVIADSYMESMKGLLVRHSFTKVRLVVGSPTRHRSIYNGVQALQDICRPDDVVLIHDAVRMFTDEKTIHDVAMAAKVHKASGVYRPLVSTVIAPDKDGFLEESLDRMKYKASEMPQGFHYSVIAAAYQRASDYDFDYGTECLLLAMKYSNVKAKLIEGGSNLWKVTHKKDLYAAEGVLKDCSIKVLVHCIEERLKHHLESKLQKRSFQIFYDKLESNEDITVHVLCYGDFITDTIELVSGEHRDHNLLDKLVMFVIKLTEDDQYINVVRHIQKLRKQYESLMYCVIYKDDSDMEQLTDTVADIVWNRNPVLSGQVLIV